MNASNNCKIKLFSYEYSKIKEKFEVEERKNTYGNDQTVLFISSSSFPASTLVGESKHGVTSSCKTNYFSLFR